MTPKIRIIHVIGSAGIGGVERLTLDILGGLDPTRYERHICCPTSPEGENAPVVKEAKKLGLHVVQIPMNSLFCFGGVRRLRCYLREQKIQLIHTQSPMGGYYGRMAARGVKGLKTLHTIQGHCYRDWLRTVPLSSKARFKKRLFITLETFLDRRTDLLVFVAERDRDVYLKEGVCGENHAIVYNGVDPDRVKSSRDKEAVRQEHGITAKFLIGNVARLSVQKHLPDFVRVAERVCRERSDVQFGIIGDGEERPVIERMIREKGLQEKCLFLSPGRERQEVIEIFAAFDLFLLTSLWEGLPVVMLESACLGVPMVVTDVNGNRDFLRREIDGLLAPPEDVEALARAVIRLLDHPDEATQMADSARRRFHEGFTLNHMIRGFEVQYKRLLSL